MTKKSWPTRCPLCKSRVEPEHLAQRMATLEVVDWLRALAVTTNVAQPKLKAEIDYRWGGDTSNVPSGTYEFTAPEILELIEKQGRASLTRIDGGWRVHFEDDYD
jgi:hypothetical protein